MNFQMKLGFIEFGAELAVLTHWVAVVEIGFGDVLGLGARIFGCWS